MTAPDGTPTWIALALPAVALLAAFVLSFRSRGASSLEQWSVADRRFGTVLVFMLLAGEIYTTFTFLGGSGWAYSRGAPAYYIVGYAAVAYAASYFLLPTIWQRGTAWRVLSQPDYYARAFDSRWFGVCVALVGIAAMFPYLVLQLRGLGILVSEASYGRIAQDTAIWIGTTAMVVYVVLAGIRGSALTAALKDALVLLAVLGLGIGLPYTLHGGIGPMFDTLIAERPDFFVLPETGFSASWFSSTIVMTVLGFYLWPHTFGSLFTARDAGSFRRNAVIMPLYQIILLFVFFIGFAAIDTVPGLTGADVDLALLRVTRQTYGPWVMGLVGAAGMLTALVPGSLILLSMGTILARLLHPASTARDPAAEVRLARLAVILVAALALAFAFRGGQTLVTLLLFAYAMVTQLFPSLMLTLLWPARAHPVAAMAGIVVGEGIVVWTTLTGVTMATAFPLWPTALTDINIGVLALIANVLVLGVLTRALPPRGTMPSPGHMTTGD